MATGKSSRAMALLEIRELRLDFVSGSSAVRALDGVSLVVNEGETVCLVGESGSGKTVTAMSVGRLLPSPPTRFAGGEILLGGRDVLQMGKRELRTVRGGVVNYVFQEPGAALNPVFRAGQQIMESLRDPTTVTCASLFVVRKRTKLNRIHLNRIKFIE